MRLGRDFLGGRLLGGALDRRFGGLGRRFGLGGLRGFGGLAGGLAGLGAGLRLRLHFRSPRGSGGGMKSRARRPSLSWCWIAFIFMNASYTLNVGPWALARGVLTRA